MTCHELEELLHVYLADELTMSEKLDVQEHLDACPSCRAGFDLERKITQNLGRLRETEAASSRLRMKVASLFDRQPDRVTHRRIAAWLRMPWLPLALAAMVMVVVAAMVLNLERSGTNGASVLRHVVSHHQAVFSSKVVPDVVAADATVVRTKLQQRLDFSFGLPVFANVKSTTLGGRICVIASKNSAHILYDVDGQLVSYFVFNPDGADFAEFKRIEVAGRQVLLATYGIFQVVMWKEGDVYCALVSGLPLPNLLALVQPVLRVGLS